MTFHCAKYAVFRNMEHGHTGNLLCYTHYSTMHMEFS